jgi:hypothetical protein
MYRLRSINGPSRTRLSSARELRRKKPRAGAVDIAVPTHYAVYGLAISSDFALRGLTACRARDLPALTLRLAASELLASDAPTLEGPTWRGRLRDSCELAVDRLAGGEVRFTYGGRARFRLAPGHRVLECAPRERACNWQRVLIGKLLGIVSVMRGYEALHASAVDSGDRVVALVGASGAGKSTLARELARRGWRLFADDTLPLARTPAGIRAHPAAGDGARPLAALCLLERRPGLALGARSLPANPLLLAPHMLGFEGDRERRRGRFQLYADLAAESPLLALTGAPEHRPAELVDALETALAQRQPCGLTGCGS